MAERKSTNKYYPPDWTPADGSLSKYHGRHPYGNRAKADGLVIRFEMPFSVWCGTCGELIPYGRRFNAVKKEVGKWHSSPIFGFRFKCNACASYIEIHTDPKNSDFVVAEGGKKKAEATEEDETTRDLPKLNNSAERERLSDPFAKLEAVHDDKERGKAALPHLDAIQEAAERRYGNSVENNRLLRAQHRIERRQVEALKKESQERGFGMTLLPSTIEDETEARIAFALKPTSTGSPSSQNSPTTTTTHKKHETKLVKQTTHDRKVARDASIFGTTHGSRTRANELMAQMKQKKVDMSIFVPKKRS